MKKYQARILDVNLSHRTFEVRVLDPEICYRFIGGRGLGAALLWDEFPKREDPLSPDAPLIFLLGPLTALLPGGAQMCTVFKSPETEKTYSHSIVGAHFGMELRFAGFDGLIIRGQSEGPVILSIEDSKVSFKEAEYLWGKGTFETEAQLKKEAKDPFVRVLSIGPAGENLVRFASIQQEYFHAAARGGAGCLMGSKKLKAITVRGHCLLTPKKPKALYRVFTDIYNRLRKARTEIRGGYYLTRWGSSVGSVRHSDANELDVKNYREAFWSDIDKIGGLEYERQYKVKTRGCGLCPVACMQVGVIKEGPYAGRVACPDYDSTSTIGAGCLVQDLDGLIYLNSLGDEWGVDNISLGNVTSFAMECYEKGVITRQDLDGIDLQWGNVEAMKALWLKILKKEGIGKILAQGVKKASQVFGKGSEKYAMQSKGLEFGAYAPQAHPDRALQFAVGDRGGCHHFGATMGEQNYRVIADSLIVCTWHRHFIDPSLYIKGLNAATGWDYTREDWDFLADRLLTMARVYNIREGVQPWEEDILPDRIHTEPLTWGTKKGAYYPKEQFLRDREEWYRKRGCDDRGVPTLEHLKKMGLDFVIPDLERILR